MPEANDSARFKNRGRRFKLDQNDHGCRYGNGSGCVHDNAQRTVIGVSLNRVNVCDLNHGEEREQDQAHYGSYRPGS
jgi:hypothetical protein